MDIKAVPGAIQLSNADAIIVNLFEGAQPGGATGAIDQALSGAIRELVESGDFTGKLGEVVVLYPRGAIPARRVILVGLGVREVFNSDIVRRAAAYAIQKARDLKGKVVDLNRRVRAIVREVVGGNRADIIVSPRHLRT